MDGEGRRRANKLHKVAISAAGAAASQHGELMLLCSIVMTQGGGGIEGEEPHPSDAGGADRDGERERQHPAVPRRRRRVRPLA